MQESTTDPSLQALGDLLRQNGFFETLPVAAIPLVAHLFQEYAQLKTTLSTIKAELLELRDTATYQQRLLQPIQQDNRRLLEENNALSLRLAEVQDSTTYKDTVPVPPAPAPFPHRQQPPVYAEHQAMEDELAKLRKYSKELSLKNSQLLEENARLRNEIQWTTAESEKIAYQLKTGKQNQNIKKQLTQSRTQPGTQQNFITSPLRESQDVQSGSQMPSISAVTSQVSHSSLESPGSVHYQDEQLQTEEEICFQCIALYEQLTELYRTQKLQKATKVQEIAQSQQHFSQEISKQNQQLLLLQNQVDELQRQIQSKNADIARLEAEVAAASENCAVHEATAIATTSLSDQLEKKITGLQQEKLGLKEQLQDKEAQISKHLEDLRNTKHECVKAEKTCKKLASALEEAKARKRLDEGVICRLDKANSTMSGFLSRLSLENQRLKRQLGIEEGFEPERDIIDDEKEYI